MERHSTPSVMKNESTGQGHFKPGLKPRLKPRHLQLPSLRRGAWATLGRWL